MLKGIIREILNRFIDPNDNLVESNINNLMTSNNIRRRLQWK